MSDNPEQTNGEGANVVKIESGRTSKVRATAGDAARRASKVKELVALPRLPKAKKPKPLKPCACGCGMETRGVWYSGHNSRHQGWLLRIQRGFVKIGDPAITDGERAVLKKALQAQVDKSKGKKVETEGA